MKIGKKEKIVIGITAVFVLLSFFLMFKDNLFSGLDTNKRKDPSMMPDATGMSEEIGKNDVIEQSFISDLSSISEVGIVFEHEYVGSGQIAIELLENRTVIASDTYLSSSIKDQHRTFLKVEPAISDCLNKEYKLRISSISSEDTGLKVLISDRNDSVFRYNNKAVSGTLCFSISE